MCCRTTITPLDPEVARTVLLVGSGKMIGLISKVPERSATYLRRDTGSEVPMQSKYHQRFLTTEQRFWQKVRKTDTCWLWTGFKAPSGYGYFQVETRRPIRAHHFLKGKPPTGLVTDHLCGVRNCVRPDHLEFVTSAENSRRWATRVTRCPQGHVYDEANTYYKKGGGRLCRVCTRERMRRRRALERVL